MQDAVIVTAGWTYCLASVWTLSVKQHTLRAFGNTSIFLDIPNWEAYSKFCRNQMWCRYLHTQRSEIYVFKSERTVLLCKDKCIFIFSWGQTALKLLYFHPIYHLNSPNVFFALFCFVFLCVGGEGEGGSEETSTFTQSLLVTYKRDSVKLSRHKSVQLQRNKHFCKEKNKLFNLNHLK